MDQTTVSTEDLAEVSLGLWVWAQGFIDNLLRPWNAYQLGIALGVFALSYLVTRLARPRMHDWMRQREGWPKWRMRVLVVLHRRLGMVVFMSGLGLLQV